MDVTFFAAQHCSSLCSQSEGGEDYSEPIADLKHFRDVTVALIGAKHCSSLCSQSEGGELYSGHAAKERTYSILAT